jgi:hypothetical protein
LTINTGTDALKVADAIAARTDPPMAWEQVDPDFTAERIAGPRDIGARWRFNIPGPMLVVTETDLPIIRALILALDAEHEAEIRDRGRKVVEQDQELLDRLAQ